MCAPVCVHACVPEGNRTLTSCLHRRVIVPMYQTTTAAPCGDTSLNEHSTRQPETHSEKVRADWTALADGVAPFARVFGCACSKVLQQCPTARRNGDTRQRCPAAMPGSDAQRRCPAAMPSGDTRQRCPAAMPGSDARRRCPTRRCLAAMHDGLYSYGLHSYGRVPCRARTCTVSAYIVTAYIVTAVPHAARAAAQLRPV